MKIIPFSILLLAATSSMYPQGAASSTSTESSSTPLTSATPAGGITAPTITLNRKASKYFSSCTYWGNTIQCTAKPIYFKTFKQHKSIGGLKSPEVALSAWSTCNDVSSGGQQPNYSADQNSETLVGHYSNPFNERYATGSQVQYQPPTNVTAGPTQPQINCAVWAANTTDFNIRGISSGTWS